MCIRRAGFEDRLLIEEVLLRFAQQKDVLVRLRAAIPDAFRHWVRFVPDYVLPEIPAVILQGERQTPGHAHQVFRFHPHFAASHAGTELEARVFVDLAGGGDAASRHLTITLRPALGAPATGVAITHVYPSSSIIPEYSAHLAEHFDQTGDEIARRFFQADLPVDPVIAEPEVGRRGDASVN
ncbi:hypothetical protein D3C76_1055440 [compost metagenome]